MNTPPNNELTDLVMFITGKGFNVELGYSSLGFFDITVTKRKREVFYKQADTPEQAAVEAKSYIRRNGWL